MAVSLSIYDVSDLCLGKPALKWLPITCTIEDALLALKTSGEICVSVWESNRSSSEKITNFEDHRCVGKISLVDIICFLCREENIKNPLDARKSPISLIVHTFPEVVRHEEPHCGLLDVLDLFLDGTQNLVVPKQWGSNNNTRKKHLQKQISASHRFCGLEFCWVTQEDAVRFLLNSIGIFSPVPTFSIETLGLIRRDIFAIEYHNPALEAIDAIAGSIAMQTSVAVVTEDGKLIGEISPNTLAVCDETVAAAIATLSAGELMAYIDCGGPPEDIVQIVKARLKDMNLTGMLDLLMESSSSSLSSSSSFSSSSSSSDDDSYSPVSTPSRFSRSGSYSARMMRGSEAIVCHPGSSLVAVMIQALAHRVNYVWVIEDDYKLAGIVTFSDILKVFREHLQSMMGLK